MFAIFIILLVLSFLVIIHELGHFLSAKLFKVRVEEFGLGYPPRAVTLFKKWQTEFTLNWIPFGGFVRMEGEDEGLPSDESEDKPSTSKTSKKTRNSIGPFYEKPAWQRLIIILAGATINFVFGILAFSIFFSFSGLPAFSVDLSQLNSDFKNLQQVEAVRLDDETLSVNSPNEVISLANQVGARVTTVAPSSPADEAGFMTGVMILSVSRTSEDGAVEKIEVETVEEAIELITEQRGQTVTITTTGQCQGFSCQEIEQSYEIYVRTEAETPAGEGSIGVAFGDVMFVYYPWWQMPFRGSSYGFQQALFLGGLILEALQNMVTEIFTQGSIPSEVAGPVGIVHQTQQSGILEEGFLSVLNFAGMLSVNLAIMNVLPIPALDGGRAVFILLELVIGRAKTARYEGLANYLGYGLLLGLIILVTVKDILAIVF